MVKRYLECGKIVNTHGLRGEVKLLCETDSPDTLLRFSTLYVDGQALPVASARVHKGCLIVRFAGVDTVQQAEALRDKTVCFDRQDYPLPPGAFFLQDYIGLTAVDEATGESLGKVDSVLYLPAGDVYVIRGQREILIPARREFIGPASEDGQSVPVRLLEGM